jgi:hypothetical protein
MRIFRRKIAATDLNVSASALRRQWARRKASAAAENSERHRQCVLAVRHLRARLPAKRLAREKEGRAPTLNLGDDRH